jgi:6-phosphogluconolactonase (cycloisomerase 2 family)
MISRNNFLPILLLVIGVVTLVNCAPSVPCVVGGAGRRVGRLGPDATTNICGTGGGGGGGSTTCSSTLMPTEVLLSVDIKGNVLEYGLNATTGVPTLMCNTATGSPGPLVVTPNNNFLYTLSADTAQIFGFQIAHAKSGALAAITGSPFKLSEPVNGGNGVATITADPLNRFIFVTNNGGDVHVLSIGQSGALAEVTNSPFTVTTPGNIAIAPSGSFAYVPSAGNGNIVIFSISSTGQLTQTGFSTVPDLTDPAVFALVHPNGKFLFTADFQSVASYTIDPILGTLTLVGTTVPTAQQQIEPDGLALDNTGKFLYVVPAGTLGGTNFQSTNIMGYQIDVSGGSGALSAIPNAPFTSSSTLGLTANPMGPELYVFSEATAPTVMIFTATIDTLGNLTIPATGLTVTAAFPPVVANIQ